MKRIEIVANRSVQEDILDALEGAIENFYYTFVPVVHGRGRQRRRLGTPTWPEENFLLIAYVNDDELETIRSTIAEVKSRFPKEGIKQFTTETE